MRCLTLSREFYDGVNFQSALITPATAGAHDLPRSLVRPYNAGFQPRVGIAWDVFGDGKTALRAGFGRYMSRTNVIEDVNRMVGNPPWTKSVDSRLVRCDRYAGHLPDLPHDGCDRSNLGIRLWV